jgi:hypothetical protein
MSQKKAENKRQKFYYQLQKQIDITNKNDHLTVCGDFNARMSNRPLPGIIDEFGELRQFTNNNHLKITYTSYRKKDIQKYTQSAQGYRPLIAYQ